ncbi:hypothetical protein D3C78_1570790 [compost metagenome]
MDALHRLDATVKSIPLADGFYHHVGGADGRWRGRRIVSDAVVTPGQQSDQQRDSREASADTDAALATA